MSRVDLNNSSRRTDCAFVGHVQGVGFRFTAQQIARDFAVTGFVRNKSDGSVELVVEGAESEIIRFLNVLRERMADHIKDFKSSDGAATGEFNDFAVRG